MAKPNFKKAAEVKRSTRSAVPQVDPAGVQPIAQPAQAPKPEVKKVEQIEVSKPKAKTVKKVEEKPILYTTYVYKEQKKNIKMHALMGDMNDQEVVQKALNEYFQNHPL